MAFISMYKQLSSSISRTLRHGLNRSSRSASFKPVGNQPESKAHYLLLTIPGAAFCLGTWQVYRLQWKKGIIAEMKERTTAEPIDLLENIDKINDTSMTYRKVKVRGTFDHSQEMYISPRSNLNKQRRVGMSQRADMGAHVFTPLKLSSSEDSIMVNRGFVTRKKTNPSTRLEGQVEGEVEFTALVRNPEKRPIFVPESDLERNRWSYRDVRMCQLAGTLPVFVDADEASTVKDGPLGGQTQINLRNEHLQYIITWYALAAATSFMYYKLRQKPANPFSSAHLRS